MEIILHGLHLLAIVTAIGGTITLRFVVGPRLPQTPEGEETRKNIFQRWRLIVWIAIALILITGFGNLHFAYQRMGFQWLYWLVFGIKFILALILFSVALLLSVPMEGLEKFRAERDRWMHIIVAIGTVILFLSAYLRHFPPKIAG